MVHLGASANLTLAWAVASAVCTRCCFSAFLRLKTSLSDKLLLSAVNGFCMNIKCKKAQQKKKKRAVIKWLTGRLGIWSTSSHPAVHCFLSFPFCIPSCLYSAGLCEEKKLQSVWHLAWHPMVRWRIRASVPYRILTQILLVWKTDRVKEPLTEEPLANWKSKPSLYRPEICYFECNFSVKKESTLSVPKQKNKRKNLF